jgi:hypothetical protein
MKCGFCRFLEQHKQAICLVKVIIELKISREATLFDKLSYPGWKQDAPPFTDNVPHHVRGNAGVSTVPTMAMLDI